MKTVKRIILILLLSSLLLGGVLLNPLIRFSVELQMDRFDAAEAVYLARLNDSNLLRQEATNQVKAYVDHRYKGYIERNTTYDQIMGILSSLSKTRLPQEDVQRCLHAVTEMETARIELAQADAFFADHDYAQAIPLFRRSLIADESAPLRLEQAESRYLDQIIEQATSAMDAG